MPNPPTDDPRSPLTSNSTSFDVLDLPGIEPARLEPFLAAVALPGATASKASPADEPMNGSLPRLSTTPNLDSAAPFSAGPRASSTDLGMGAAASSSRSSAAAPFATSSLDASELARRLEPFMADPPPLVRSMPAGSPPARASGEAGGSAFTSRLAPDLELGAFFDAPSSARSSDTEPLATDAFSWSRPGSSNASLDGFSQANVPAGGHSQGLSSPVEARLTSVLDRLEQVARQLETSGEPVRRFRGRIDD